MSNNQLSQTLNALCQIAVLAEYGTTGPGKCVGRSLTQRQATSLRLSVSTIARKHIAALEATLAQPDQEPVAYMYHGVNYDGTPHDRRTLIWRPEYMDALSSKMGAVAVPLYTACKDDKGG